MTLLIPMLGMGHSGRGVGRIRVSVRNTLSYPKALEKLSSQTIISLMLHAYVVMRLSTSLTPPKFRRGHMCGECLSQIKLDTPYITFDFSNFLFFKKQNKTKKDLIVFFIN